MLVGKSLEDAILILEKNSEQYVVIRYNDDKPHEKDTELVIRERKVDGKVELVVTDVKKNV
ncbi:MAG: hypothetical protein PUK83_07105 [Clostridia bacterium]|nr:hypothetical protein [Clostridia bacterium]MDY5264736.1 hypothetical protein [Eubacteriales bacterium]MDY5439748.1 hypothetical protein [Eubacteriales bacterium]